jgi:hypothetical protein
MIGARLTAKDSICESIRDMRARKIVLTRGWNPALAAWQKIAFRPKLHGWVQAVGGAITGGTHRVRRLQPALGKVAAGPGWVGNLLLVLRKRSLFGSMPQVGEIRGHLQDLAVQAKVTRCFVGQNSSPKGNGDDQRRSLRSL